MDSHKKINELLSAYVLGELPDEQGRQVQSHLAQCQSCRDELKQLESVLLCTEDLRGRSADNATFESAKARLLVSISNDKSNKQSAGTGYKLAVIWSRFMNNKTAKIAIAAAILIVCGTLWYHVTGTFDGATPAFAQVLEEIKKVKSVCYKKTLQIGDRPPFTTTDMINENGVQRNEFEFGGVHICDFPHGIYLQLDPKAKRVHRSVRPPMPHWKTYNALDFLATQHEKCARFAGKEMIDGIETDLYKNEQPLDFTCTSIWVNPETNLPVRVVRECIPPRNSNYLPIKTIILHSSDFRAGDGRSMSGDLSGSCTPLYTKKVMTDFQWNVDLDPALFSTEMPADYTEQHELRISEPNEFYLVETLKLWAEMSDGSLPLDVKEMMDPNTMRAMLIKKFAKGQNPQAEYQQAGDFMETIRWAAVFAERKIIKTNWFATAEPVFLGEGDKPLYWWKIENSDRYRVIYGDLSIRDCDQPPTGQVIETQ